MPVEWELSYVDLELLNRHEAGFRRHPQVVHVSIDEVSVRDRTEVGLRVELRDSYDPELHSVLERWRREARVSWERHVRALEEEARQRLGQALATSIRQGLDHAAITRRTMPVEPVPVLEEVRGQRVVFEERVVIPTFEVSSNPSISLSDVRTRRFSCLDSESFGDIVKAPQRPKHVEVLPAKQDLPDWVAVGARMRSMLPGGPGSVTVTAIYWVDFLGDPCEDTENEPNHRIIEWYKGGDTGFWSTARDWFHDDWQFNEVEPAPWWERL